MQETLNRWINSLREKTLSLINTKSSPTNVVSQIELIEQSKMAINKNANTQLALEVLLLDLEK